MVWFFIGGIIIAVFLLAFVVIDIVYSYKIYNNNNISQGEGIFLIVINSLALVIVLAMIAMFFFQVIRYGKSEGFKPPPLSPQSIAKEFGVDQEFVKGMLEDGKNFKSKMQRMVDEKASEKVNEMMARMKGRMGSTMDKFGGMDKFSMGIMDRMERINSGYNDGGCGETSCPKPCGSKTCYAPPTTFY